MLVTPGRGLRVTPDHALILALIASVALIALLLQDGRISTRLRTAAGSV